MDTFMMDSPTLGCWFDSNAVHALMPMDLRRATEAIKLVLVSIWSALLGFLQIKNVSEFHLTAVGPHQRSATRKNRHLHTQRSPTATLGFGILSHARRCE